MNKQDLGIKIWSIICVATSPMIADEITKHIMKAVEEEIEK